jgi:protein-disulfide isomerase-like protein with CxxC motif
MPATVRFYTDPACSWSWGAEPALRRLIWEELSARPGPVISSELWMLARDWKLPAIPAMTGTLWELP